MTWPEMLRCAVHVHGLTPQQFWALSWREWLWLNPPAPKPLSRNDVEALMSQFPDR
jgi:uncharacterized phage protein (TIGR02216 family)